MKRLEDIPVISPSLELTSTPEGVRAKGLTYEVLFNANKPYVNIMDTKGNAYAELSLVGGVDTTTAVDETLNLPTVMYEQKGNEAWIRLSSTSTLWDKKEQVWVCRPNFVEMYYEVQGKGAITSCNYFAGNYADQKTGSGRFSSRAKFQSVFNPEPTSTERRAHSTGQSSSINVTGLAKPGREDWFFTPPPYCYGLSLQSTDEEGILPSGQWLMMGIAAPVEQQHFTAIRYDGEDEAFSLSADYEGHTYVDGVFRSPSVLLHFTDDPYVGMADYMTHTTTLQLLSQATTPVIAAEWWKRPIFCGWGAQAELADQRVDKKTAQDFSTQSIYDTFLGQIEQHNLRPGTITIDDKWQKTYGENEVDEQKWPDLKGWIGRRHKLGQKVLLWLKAWDNEGLPDELCVRTSAGKAITVDPSNPEYLTLLRQQVDTMLGVDGYDADGFKIDFTARTPSGRNLRRMGEEWGTSLLHRYLKTIYDQAKITKPDSLIVTHTPNPSFNDVTDMVRLNDINCNSPVIPQMQHRARVVQAVCPDKLIDTDNWPMPNIEQWRMYLKEQPKLGVVALYFTNTVAGTPMLPGDYKAIRRSWSSLRGV